VKCLALFRETSECLTNGKRFASREVANRLSIRHPSIDTPSAFSGSYSVWQRKIQEDCGLRSRVHNCREFTAQIKIVL